MKKLVLMTVLAGFLPLSMMAQDDDLYFTPKKSSETGPMVEKSTYYSGSDRSVDEYNRRGKYWSHYQKIGTDGKGNDIIQFSKGKGVYPDSTYIDTTFVGKYYDSMTDADDYRYTQRMSRWDGFYNPWYYSYSWGFGPYWGYGPRWCYGWYDPFYDPWYDPWYYGYYGYGYGYPYYGYAGWYGGWYSPWYYGGYYGGYYGYPYYSGYVSYNRPTGTMNHSYASNSTSFPAGSFGEARSRFSGSRSSMSSTPGVRVGNSGMFGGSRAVGGSRSYNNGNTDIPSRSYNNSPSRGSYNQVPTRSYNSGSFNSGSSFGGSVHSGGGFSGGHSGGGFSGGGGGFSSGGSFGGRR